MERLDRVLAGKSVLIVEDEPDFARLLEFILERAGCEVLLAVDAAGGLEAARRRRPDLLILDLRLPDGDGADLCRRLRLESAVPILCLTAGRGHDERALCLGLGADDFMVKPVPARRLIERVAALIENAAPAEAA